VATITLTHTTIGGLFPSLPSAIRDLNVGIIALGVNLVVLVAVSAATQRSYAARTTSSAR
jgi:SSS family solute:Na+ symporter